MQETSRFKKARIRRRDWIGDSVLVILCGIALVTSVFMPWANEDIGGRVNFSVHRAEGISGVLGTQWGTPALLIALAVPAVGLVMLLLAPRRGSWLLGVFVAVLGFAAFAVAQDAAGGIMWFDPGVGLYLTTLVGVLLVPTGLAAAMVAWILVRTERDSAEPAAPATATAAGAEASVTPAGPSPVPPSPESDPPS